MTKDKIFIIDKITIVVLTMAMLVASHKYYIADQQLEFYQKTLEPVSECIQHTHFSINGKDAGYGYHVSDYGLPGFDCDRRVGEAVHKLLTE